MSTDLQWFKNSNSTGEGGNCIEAATCPHLRDSNDFTVPALTPSPAAWAAFLKNTAV